MEKFETALNKPVPQAEAEINNWGTEMRNNKKDGENLVVNLEYVKSRVNVEVIKGIVVKIINIG